MKKVLAGPASLALLAFPLLEPAGIYPTSSFAAALLTAEEGKEKNC